MKQGKRVLRETRERKVTNRNIENYYEKIREYDACERSGHDSLIGVLLRFMSERGMTSSEVYGAAMLDRRLFLKLVNAKDPASSSKRSLLQIAIGLKLSLPETRELLASDGKVLNPLETEDNVFKFCIEQQIYNMEDVTDLAYMFGVNLAPRTYSSSDRLW